MKHIIPAIVLLVTTSAAGFGQDAGPFSKYTIVDMVYKVDLDKSGQVVNQVIRRFVIKDAGILTIGNAAYINGSTPGNVVVDGTANWSQITLPMDKVIALVGVATPAELQMKGGVLNAEIGFKIKD